MTGHELRYQNGFDCQGLWVEVEVEKELEPQEQARHREPRPRRPFDAASTSSCSACKDRVDKFARVQTEQSIRLGYWMDWDRTDEDWAKPPDERKSYFTMSEENNYTIWALPEEVPRARAGLPRLRLDAVVPACGVGISEMEMKEGYKLVEHRAVLRQASRCADRPGENLLVWTTTPWTLTSNVGAAVNPELTYLKVKLKGEVYYVAKGAFTAEPHRRRQATTTRSRASKRGQAPRVARRRAAPQDASSSSSRRSRQGRLRDRRRGEGRRDGRLGVRRPVRRAAGAGSTRTAIPTRWPRSSQQQGWAPGEVGARRRTASSPWDGRRRDRGHRHRPHRAGLRQGRLPAGQGERPAAGRAARRRRASSSPASARSTGKNAVDPATADAVFDDLKEKDLLFATERYSTATRTAGAARRSCCSASWTSGSST